MKKIIKNPIFTFILGIILAGSIGVYASTQYMASQVTYNKNGKATVEAALNDLYDKSKHHHLIFSPVSEEEFESIGRSSFSVQAGTDEMYIVFSLGTNSSVGNPTISGDIVESSEQVGFNTYTDVHNNKYFFWLDYFIYLFLKDVFLEK